MEVTEGWGNEFPKPQRTSSRGFWPRFLAGLGR